MKILSLLVREESRLDAELGKIRAAISALNGNRRGYKWSAAARQRMSIAQKKRWAKKA
jgi:hypothetical protein